jgi:hypothetical protein
LWPRQFNSGVGLASGQPGQALADQVFFSSRLSLCPCSHRYLRLWLIEEQLRVHLTKREKPRKARPTEPSRGTPTPPGYVYLTRHLCTRQLTLDEVVQIADRRVLVLEMRKKHGSAPKIHTCSGPDSRNEQNTGIQGAITNGTPVPSPQVRATPHDRGACGATEGRRMAHRRPLQQQRQ